MRNQQDFWTGVLFLFLGLGFSAVAQGYAVGAAARMGPGYFPSVLGGFLAIIGGALTVRSMWSSGSSTGGWHFRSLILIPCSIAVFMLGVQQLGFVLTAILTVAVGTLATSRFDWRRTVVLSLGLAAFGALLFINALGLQMPLWPRIGLWS